MTRQQTKPTSIQEPLEQQTLGRAPKSKRRWPAYVTSLILGAALIGGWSLLVASGLVHQIILPSPLDVAQSIVDLAGQDFLYRHLSATVRATAAGFLIGSLLGFGLGVSLGMSDFIRRVLSPYIVMFWSLPKVALAPIFVTWFGFGISSKIVMATVICFFPVFVDTLSGMWLVDENSHMLLRSLNASRRQILGRLSLPSALPNIFAGLKIAITIALVGVVVGEFVGTREGIGYLIELYSFQLQIADVFALIFILGFIGWLFYAIVDYADRHVVFWRDDQHK